MNKTERLIISLAITAPKMSWDELSRHHEAEARKHNESYFPSDKPSKMKEHHKNLAEMHNVANLNYNLANKLKTAGPKMSKESLKLAKAAENKIAEYKKMHGLK
jgi:competence CoiA-like predicted nuclease